MFKTLAVLVPTLVGGLGLTAAAVITSVVLFQPSAAPGVQGTIPPGSVQLTIGTW